MPYRLVFLFSLQAATIALCPLQSEAADGPAEDSRVVATYSSGVTETELADWMHFLGRQAAESEEVDLRQLILVRSMAAEAERLGLDQRADVRLEIELRDTDFATVALRRELSESIQVSEHDVEAKYQQFKDTFTMPRRVRLRNLFKRYPPGASAEIKAALRREVEELRRRVLDGEDFGELAAAHSDSQTRFQKGLLGNVPAGTLDPKVEAIAMALHPGEVSVILGGTSGLTLLYCEKILEKVERSPEELRKIAGQRLKAREFKRRWAETQAGWLAVADPRYHWEVLVAGDDSSLVLEFLGGAVSVAQLKFLMGEPAALFSLPRPKLRQRLESYVRSVIALGEAERRGLLKGDEIVAKRLWSKRQILSQKTLLHLISQRFTKPTDAEARQYYEKHSPSFVRPPHFELGAILLPSLAGGDVQEIYRQGALLVDQLKTGDLTFEEAARRHSRHPSAAEGGRLGWISRPALPRTYGLTILKAVVGLDVGQASDLVQDGDNLWILRLLAQEAERPLTWDEAQPTALDLVGTERAKDLEIQINQEWMDGLGLELRSPGPQGSGTGATAPKSANRSS